MTLAFKFHEYGFKEKDPWSSSTIYRRKREDINKRFTLAWIRYGPFSTNNPNMEVVPGPPAHTQKRMHKEREKREKRKGRRGRKCCKKKEREMTETDHERKRSRHKQDQHLEAK
jgi:hypothetical protein